MAVGDIVKARFLASSKGPKKTYDIWYPGVVHQLHKDGSYDIVYDDGDKELRVLPEFVKALSGSEKAASEETVSESEEKQEAGRGRRARRSVQHPYCADDMSNASAELNLVPKAIATAALKPAAKAARTVRAENHVVAESENEHAFEDGEVRTWPGRTHAMSLFLQRVTYFTFTPAPLLLSTFPSQRTSQTLQRHSPTLPLAATHTHTQTHTHTYTHTYTHTHIHTHTHRE